MKISRCLILCLLAGCARAPIPLEERVGADDLRSIAIVAAGDATQAGIDNSEPRDRRGTVIGAGGGALGGAAFAYG